MQLLVEDALPEDGQLKVVSGFDDFFLGLLVLEAGEVDAVDGQDHVAGLEAEGLTR